MEPTASSQSLELVGEAMALPGGPLDPAFYQKKTKKKKAGGRVWLVADIHGGFEVSELEKRDIMRRTAVPARDLRVLGTLFSASAAILAREGAMLVNLEHIKAIVTAEEVLVLDPTNENVAPFVNKLRRTLKHHVNPTNVSPSPLTGSPVPEFFGFYSAFSGGPTPSSMSPLVNLKQSVGAEGEQKDLGGMTMLEGKRAPVGNGGSGEPDMLPFEFRVLELILETILHHLDTCTQTLVQHAYPVLEELRRGVSTESLEEVRDVKSRMTRLTARVQKVREELEQLLDDDEDMWDLYLTRHRILASKHPDSPAASSNYGVLGKPLHRENSLELNMSEPGGGSVVQELEMLLEAYFMQVDGTLNKLNTLREDIDDTEDYVNIELDRRRNQLIQFRLHLNSANCTFTASLMFIGAYGMNFPNPWVDNNTGKPFAIYLSIVTVIAVCLYVGFRLYLRWAHMLGL